jgi:hypothetical protein
MPGSRLEAEQTEDGRHGDSGTDGSKVDGDHYVRECCQRALHVAALVQDQHPCRQPSHHGQMRQRPVQPFLVALAKRQEAHGPVDRQQVEGVLSERQLKQVVDEPGPPGATRGQATVWRGPVSSAKASIRMLKNGNLRYASPPHHR